MPESVKVPGNVPAEILPFKHLKNLTKFCPIVRGAMPMAPRGESSGLTGAPTKKMPCCSWNLHACNVSENRTAAPTEGVTSSPSHITRWPRTMVPTGHPVTVTPS